MKTLELRKAKNHTVKFASTEPMDKLVIFNGSPRRSGSNSAMVLEKAAETIGYKVEIRDLKEEYKWDEWAESFTSEKNVMFFMPLYVHRTSITSKTSGTISCGFATPENRQ